MSRLLFFLLFFLFIALTVLASVSASPTFSSVDLSVSLNDGESEVVSIVVYDLDELSVDDVFLVVSPHPDYVSVPSFIKDIHKYQVDSHAVRVDFTVFVPNSQDIGFHRELITLNNQQVLNVAIYNDVSFVSSVKSFLDRDVRFGGLYVSLFSLFFVLFVLVILVLIFLLYRRFLP